MKQTQISNGVGLQQEGNPPKQLGGCTGKGFLPGKSGNPSGKRKGEVSITAGLKRALAKGETLEKVIEAILAGVIEKKDSQFAKLLLDRIDGSIKEQIEARLNGGTIIAPSANVGVIILPDNHRQDPVPPNLMPPVDVEGNYAPSSPPAPALPTPAPEHPQTLAEPITPEREQPRSFSPPAFQPPGNPWAGSNTF